MSTRRGNDRRLSVGRRAASGGEDGPQATTDEMAQINGVELYAAAHHRLALLAPGR
jgi:hypothetical protein